MSGDISLYIYSQIEGLWTRAQGGLGSGARGNNGYDGEDTMAGAGGHRDGGIVPGGEVWRERDG